MLTGEILIWAKIILWCVFFFGPTFLALWLIRSSRNELPSCDDICTISPHPAVMLPSLPFLVGIFGLVWALTATQTAIHFWHIVGFFMMFSIVYAFKREHGARWRVEWTEDRIAGPTETGFLRAIKRITLRWDDLTEIREERGGIFLETSDGRSIQFARKYRGYLSFMRAVYRKRPDLEASRAPREWSTEIAN